jgi:hypothetical protein
MNKIKIAVLSLFLALAMAFGVTAEAQTTLTQPTLAAAVTDGANTKIRLASVTGVVAGTSMLYVEDGTGAIGLGEVMFVNAVTGTTVSVTRGYYGSNGNPHISGALVLIGAPNQFYAVEPTGACTPAAQPVTPYLNVKTGNEWLCSSILNRWVPGFGNTTAPLGATAAVATAATIVPSGPLFHTTGTVAVVTITPPTGFSDGQITIIFDGSSTGLTWTAAGNIAVAGTATTALSSVTFTWDKNTSKWYPSRLA